MHRTYVRFPRERNVGAGRLAFSSLDIDQRASNVALLVQSGEEPDWSYLPEGYLFNLDREGQNPATKTISNSLEALHKGQVLRFRLRANPTKRIDTKSGPDGQRRNGRRVDLRTETQQVEWLSRRSDRRCSVCSLNPRPHQRPVAPRDFAGRSRLVTLPDSFRRLLESQIQTTFVLPSKRVSDPARHLAVGSCP